MLPGDEKPEIPGDEACDGFEPGEALWSRLWGDASDQRPFAINVGADGTMAVGGAFSGSLDFPQPLVSAGNDAWVAKFDGSGNVLWGRAFGDADFQHITGVALAPSGGVVVAGSFNGTILFGQNTLNTGPTTSVFVAKLDSDGAPSWIRHFVSGGLSLSTAVRLALDPTGHVVVAGTFSGSVDLGGTQINGLVGADVFVCKLNLEDGSVIWAKAVNGPGDQFAQAVAVDPGGNIIVTGIATASFSNGFDNVYVADGSSATFVLRMDSLGNLDWLKRVGGQGGTQLAADVTVDGLGNIYLAGIFKGSLDVGDISLTSNSPSNNLFFTRLNTNGKPVWAQRFGEASFAAYPWIHAASHADGSTRLTVHAVGDINFGGGLLSGVLPEDGASDFLAVFDAEGKHAWSKVFPDAYKEGFCVVAAAENADTMLACGAKAATLDYGAGVLDGKGSQDLAITRFSR